MATLDYSSARERLDWLGYASLAAAVPLIHFALAAGIWVMWWVATLTNPSMRPRLGEELARDGMYAAPAFVLLIPSTIAYVRALRRRRRVWRMLAIVIAAAMAFCWIDVHFHRYQVSVCMATDEYWRNGGRAHHYFNWWWFDDRWVSVTV